MIGMSKIIVFILKHDAFCEAKPVDLDLTVWKALAKPTKIRNTYCSDISWRVFNLMVSSVKTPTENI